MAKESKYDDVAIGIDLGTTYSCVGVWQDENNRVEIIANELGERTTPSYVAFTSTGEILVGASAKSQASTNPTNTVFDAKRLIGRKFTDPIVQADLKYFPFKLSADENNKPIIEVTKGESVEKMHPEQISALVLAKLKKTAEDFLGHPVKNAVVTVPAYFNDSQRQATKDAGFIAGLNVIRVLNEPTSAALAYGLDKKYTVDGTNILIFDLGGGTFDTSLLTLSEGGIFEVLATAGDTHLGGEDFDNRMVDYCVEHFKKTKKIDVSKNNKALRKLRTVCEKAKKNLSTQTQAMIDVDSLAEGEDFSFTMTRAKFEELCNDLFKKCLVPVEKVLKDSGLSKTDIQEVVLVGGSTRIPAVQKILSNYFNGKELCKSINPDEAVAYGAAVQAAALTKKDIKEGDKLDITVMNVTPLSLGVEAAGGIMAPIVKRNSVIPCKKSMPFSTHADNQPGATIKVYEGERQFTKDNNLLGVFQLNGIPPAPRGVPKINITFDIDPDGILQVTATEEGSGTTGKIVITNDKGRLTKEQIEEMLAKAEQFKAEDDEKAKVVEAKNLLESYLYNWKNQLSNKEFCAQLKPAEVEHLTFVVNDGIKWIEEHPDASYDEYTEKKKEVEESIKPILTSVYEQDDDDKKTEEKGPVIDEVD